MIYGYLELKLYFSIGNNIRTMLRVSLESKQVCFTCFT